eukprot:Lithocolla_globosa_v1_NODE_1139_length_2842_cov_6.310011.p2 type:complete len:258 gc:universal NODE_1139_length_2842_cov_6.310011:1046-1819(+)
MLFGTRQGGVLSPLFYLCFINELMTRLKELGVGLRVLDGVLAALLVMDDIVLLSDSTEEMSMLLSETTLFADEWRVRFHLSEGPRVKSAALLFSPHGDFLPPPRGLMLCGREVPAADAYCYVGFVLTSSPSENLLHRGLAARCSAARHATDAVLSSLHEGAATGDRMGEYVVRIRPVLEYPLVALFGLTYPQWLWINRVDESIRARLGLPVAMTGDRISDRVRVSRHAFLGQMKMAPSNTWRRRFADCCETHLGYFP